MGAKELILNIAVNLNRISRFAMEGKVKRVKQFVDENDEYIKEVDKLKLSDKFNSTFERFKKDIVELKNKKVFDEMWSEEMLTWANILEHRAKLA